MIGRTILHYQIVETLGRGGMGVVYKARDTHLDRFVAIKVLPPEKVADPERKLRFVQEAKAASALNHPNIIHLYDIAEADGVQFIAMEYVAGETLDQMIGGKGLRLNQTLKYATFPSSGSQCGIVGDDGSPLSIPSLGGSSTTINLAPSGTAVIEAPNTGHLTEGYVSASLPTGVVGYGVFRWSAPGRADQEAVVPLSGASSTASHLIFDDTNLVTAVAIVNPSPVATVVSIAARDTTGNLIGTSTVPLGANAKTAVILRDLLGLAAMAGKRGSADFTVAAGKVAVLGLRADGPAITSIPTSVIVGLPPPVSPNPQPSPAITSLSPTSSPAGVSSPLTLTINGSGFIPSSSVTFNGISHAPSFFNSGLLSISLSVSDLAVAGNFPVVVTNASPGGGTSNTMFFSVTPSKQVVNLTGSWQGTWVSGVYLFVFGSLSANLNQSGTTLTGSVSFGGSPCFSGGTVSGTLIGNILSASLDVGGGQTVSLNASPNCNWSFSITVSFCSHGIGAAPRRAMRKASWLFATST
jgi:hypothetical protein